MTEPKKQIQKLYWDATSLFYFNAFCYFFGGSDRFGRGGEKRDTELRI